jgi:hypothetical protein
MFREVIAGTPYELEAPLPAIVDSSFGKLRIDIEAQIAA